MTDQPLKLTGDIHIANDTDQLYDDLAGLMIRRAFEAVEERGVFHLALSGGSTPEPFYVRMVIDPRFRAMPWKHTHVWIVDERCVPEDDPRSNIKMIRESLLDHVTIRERQIHPMPVLTDNGDILYEQDIIRTLGEETATIKLAHADPKSLPRFDFILLGMGDDTHTASLFPNSPAIGVSEKLITFNRGPAVTPPDRMTMTYPLLNTTRHIVILVTGSAKHDALCKIDKQLRDAGPDSKQFPITGINPHETGGYLTWFLDSEASGQEIDNAIDLA